jgi:hypothetical protein
MEFLVSLDLSQYDRLSPGVNANCEVAANGKYYYIETNKLDTKKLYTYQPIRKDRKIIKSRDGVYAYIIASTEEEQERKTAHIYAIRTLTVHEIKTKHAHLVNRLSKPSPKNNGKGIRYLHYAGEFFKEGDSIMFNFMSGTYMAENVPLITTDKDVDDNLQHINSAKTVFTTYGMPNTRFTRESLIDKSRLSMSKEDIDTLVKYGAEVYEYDSRHDCEYRNKYKGMLARKEQVYKQQMRTYNTYKEHNEKNGKLPPIFEKPPSPIEGRLLQMQESPTILGKRKKSSGKTVSSIETSLPPRKTRKTVVVSKHNLRKSTRRNTI